MSISESRPFRVLVVDDNRDAARILALLLSKVGHEVLTAYSGAEALNVAERHRPECIISDIGMPGLDGYELAKRIRSDQRFEGIPLIALTAYTDSAKVLDAGFDHHLVKPVRMSAIVPLIAEIQALRTRLKQMESVADAQTAAMGTVNDLMHEMKDEVRALNSELKEEVRELKQALEEVKEEVKEIKEELKESQD